MHYYFSGKSLKITIYSFGSSLIPPPKWVRNFSWSLDQNRGCKTLRCLCFFGMQRVDWWQKSPSHIDVMVELGGVVFPRASFETREFDMDWTPCRDMVWILLMVQKSGEKTWKNHLRFMKNPVNNGGNYQPQQVSRISSLNSSIHNSSLTL